MPQKKPQQLALLNSLRCSFRDETVNSDQMEVIGAATSPVHCHVYFGTAVSVAAVAFFTARCPALNLNTMCLAYLFWVELKWFLTGEVQDRFPCVCELTNTAGIQLTGRDGNCCHLCSVIFCSCNESLIIEKYNRFNTFSPGVKCGFKHFYSVYVCLCILENTIWNYSLML